MYSAYFLSILGACEFWKSKLEFRILVQNFRLLSLDLNTTDRQVGVIYNQGGAAATK
jgi:hypothetical protein